MLKSIGSILKTFQQFQAATQEANIESLSEQQQNLVNNPDHYGRDQAGYPNPPIVKKD